MWRLVIADTFHVNKATPQAIFYILYFNIYFNIIVRTADSGYEYTFLLLTLMMLLSLFISPIRIAKGLYLCPLTENDRKKFLKMSCIFRFTVFEFIGIVCFVLFKQLYSLENTILLLTFFSFTGILLTTLLLSGFYNPTEAKKYYYISKKLPVPNALYNSQKKHRTPWVGNFMLITTLTLSVIGLLLSFNMKSFDYRWFFYYIPAVTIGVICMAIYFIKYFDLFITINANHEVYSYTRRKKVGVFHAD